MDNRLKTVILLALLTALLLWVGQLVGGAQGLIIAGIIVLIMNFASFWFSDKIVLRMYKAKQIQESDNPRLYKIVKEVTHLANIPMPKLYIMPSSSSNAFATGRGPKKSAVATTQGILELLNDDELKGVIAHEISHIKHRDVLIQTITGMIAGIISYVAFFARWGAMFGGFGGRDGDNNIVELLVLAIVTPLMATIIQMAISRSREFLADEGAAKLLHNPFGLANALEKLESNNSRNPLKFGNNSTAHLFIVHPFKRGFLSNIFSTHPTTEARVNKLKSLGY